ncbi:MAG: DUF1533 domain-containing protein [Clostridia bacterium]|nr:DUF1533 domain-containing protein [Clostridia bacterium]
MKKTNKLLSALLAVAMTAGQAAALTSAETNDYFLKNKAIDVAVFGGSIVGSAGNSNWSNIVTDYIGKNYNGGKGANITKYNCGGVGSTVGLSRMAQLVNTTGKESTFAPDVVIIEYAVNDQQYDFTVDTSSDVTASTEVKYENGKLNIYDEETNTYEFDYVNPINSQTYPTGHYKAKVNETNLLASTKRIEEMVRLAQSLENKPAIFLVNVGLGLTLGDGHSIRPSFPGFMNSMATEYDKIAERLGIGYIDVEKSVWEYIENQIAAGIDDGTYSNRASALDAIQWKLYGDESNIHPTEKGCVIYADIINSKIAANPENYLTAKSEITGYTNTTAYSENSHFIPYTAGAYDGEDWSVTALPTSNNEVFDYAMTTSTTGDSVSFDFNGNGLLVYTTGGSYSYKIEDKADDTVICESSGSAKGIYCFDDATTFGEKKLSKDGSYRITLTKSSNDTTALNVVGVMVNMEMGNYPTFTEFNAANYIPYSQQYFDFTNKDTAQDDSIETYFADMTDIAYNEGSTAVIKRVEDRGALKVTASQTDVNLLTITPNNVGTSVLNIEFDLKIDTEKTFQQNLNLAVGTSSSLINVFRVLQSNAASPCINTGSNRYSTSVDNWWKANCNDDNYHNIRLRLIPQSTGGRSVELYIDGNKGDTVFSANNLTNIETIQFNNATTNTQSVACEFYLDDIRIYDEVTRVQNLISAIGNVTLMSEKAINEARNAADEINEYMGSSNAIANYSTLTAAEEKLKELKQAVEAVTLAPAAVNVPVVGVNQVFDYSGLTVEKVYVNGTEISDAKTKEDARLLIPASHFTEAGKYSITITGAGLEKLYEHKIENVQKIIYHDDTTVTKLPDSSWGTIGAQHGSRQDVAPAKLDVTKDNFETLKPSASLKFGSLPQGTYKIYFYNINPDLKSRIIPMDAEILISDGSKVTKDVIGYNGAKGYAQIGDDAYTLGENSSLELTIADDAPKYPGSDGLFAVDSIMLERVWDADIINTYFETGKTELTFKKAAVNSDYVGYDMAFDYEASITISSVTVNDKALDATAYSAKSGRLFIDSSAFSTGDNTVTISDGAVSVSCTVTLKAAEAVKYYANTHSGIVKEGTWANTVGEDWTDSEDKTVVVAERADISNTQNVSITYNTLPEGRYKVEYYVSGHNSISSSSIRVADTNITVKDKNGEHIINSVKPAASTIGYIDLGVYDFGESEPDNYIKAVPNVDGYVPDLFLSYAVRLTPVGNDALVKLYAETGCTNLAEYVNGAANKQEALVNAENYGYEIDNASLKDMTSVYAAIAKKTFTSDYEVIAEFNKAVSDKLKTVEYSAQAGKILYTGSGYFYREKISMQAGRFGFLMYEGIAHPELIKSVKAKPVATNNYDTIIDRYSQSIIETKTWGDITGDELTKVTSYESDMTKFDHQYAVRSSRVELPKEIISMNGQTALRFKTDRDTQVEYSDIVLYVTYDNSTGAFDEPLVVTEYYTIDKVSFVNAVDGKEETAQIGYVGSAYVTKKGDEVPDAVLVAASYTADGKLDVLKTVPLSNLTTGESTKVGINLNTVKNPGSVKIFVWSGISGMTPYASLCTVNSPTNTDVEYASAWYLPDGTFEYVPKN